MIKIIIKTLLIAIIFSVVSPAQETPATDTASVSGSQLFVMQKSPWGAVARSALLPGWGQFYTEQYWHIPVIWGFMGWFGYNWVLNNDKYKSNKNLFIETGNEDYRLRRDFYRDQRDNFAIYFVITYFLNLVDAYATAHLFDFSVEEDYVTRVPRLKITYHF